MYIYTSKVGKGISGEVFIERIERLPIAQIKLSYLDIACISEEDFASYYLGCEDGFVIHLSTATKYKNIIPLKNLQLLGFNAPQSFMYANNQIDEYIQATKCI